MPLIKSKSPKAFKANVSELIRSGKPRDRSLAIAYRIQREGRKRKYQDGGEVDESAYVLSPQAAAEAAAARTRQSVRPAEGRASGELTQLIEDSMIPKTPLDVGLMVAGGPFSRFAKAGALGLGAALQSSQAEAGPLGRLLKSSPEKIVSAAIRTKDGIFKGPTHGSAWAKAADEGVDVGKLAPDDIDGFITSTGRYVSREEAAKLADAFGQTRDLGAKRLESSTVHYGKGDIDVVTREEAIKRRPDIPSSRMDSPYYVVGRDGTFGGFRTKAEADAYAGLAIPQRADGGAVDRLPDHYADVGSSRIEDRRDSDGTLRAMGLAALKTRASGKQARNRMASDMGSAEIVDMMVPRGYADGGAMDSPYSGMMPKSPAPHAGFIPGPTGGRADAVPMSVKQKSYVIPADVVSSLGEGNSEAGAKKLGSMFSGPYGTKAPKIKGRAPKTTKVIRQKFENGGMVDMEPPAEIAASSGEYVVDPEQVAALGGGDTDHGHDILDALVKQIRQQTIKTLKRLPGPKSK